MRRAWASILGLALLASVSDGRAGVCAMGYFQIIVPGSDKTLPRNGHVLFETQAQFTSLIEAKHVTIAFSSASASIPARVVRRLQGGYSGDCRQLLLAPSADLEANVSYHLTFANAEGRALDRYERQQLAELNERAASFPFTALAEPDNLAPKWRARPSLGDYSYSTEKGSTSDNSFKVAAPLGKDFSGFVLAHIVPVTRPGPALDVLFVVSTEQTRIGSLDCYSMFAPSRGVYTVALTAIDLGGNEAKAPGKALALWFPRS